VLPAKPVVEEEIKDVDEVLKSVKQRDPSAAASKFASFGFK
jgi:hypothetical protein